MTRHGSASSKYEAWRKRLEPSSPDAINMN
jgi:hypothetical protein